MVGETSVAEELGPLQPGLPFAGRYRVRRLLGHGDRKWTYLAEDEKVGDRLVALSLVKPEAAAIDPEGTRREANRLSRVGSYSHIVTFHEYDSHDGWEYLVFEYVSGGTLSELIEHAAVSGEEVPAEAIIRYGRELAGALEQVHAAGMIHRDVAPQNIWLDDRKKVKLGDFDSAILLADLDEPRPSTTDRYRSPEDRAGGPLDERTDLYSLGAVLASLALGQLDFGVSAPTTSRRLDLPAPFHDLVAALLAQEREDRPSSAGEVRRQLKEIEALPDVRSIIEAGEGQRVEFKSSLRFVYLPDHLSDADRAEAMKQNAPKVEKAILKTIAGFLNSEGGTLLVGVQDDGQILGIEADFETLPNVRHDRDGWQQYLRQLTTNALGIGGWACLDVTFYTTEDGTVARIDCPRRSRETWLKLKAGEEVFYRRTGSSTDQLPPSEAARYVQDHWSS